MSAWVLGGTSGIGQNIFKHLCHRTETYVTGCEEFNVATHGSIGFKRKLEEFGYPEWVVYSAGTNYLEFLGKNLLKTWRHDRVIDVNLKGFIRLMDAMASLKNQYDRSCIKPSVVAISSDAAERPLRTSIGYCASKAGLNMAVRVAARELGPHGWRINAVSPGMTHSTKMTDYVDAAVPRVRDWSFEEALDYEVSQEVTPGRINPSEISDVVLDVLTGPTHLNGSIITINGGR